MTERIFLGHFLTRVEAARRAGVSHEEVLQRPDLLHIGGTWLEEVYFAFQFNAHGIRPELGSIVRSLREQFDDIAIADWLARPNDLLSAYTPLHWLATGGDESQVADAAARAGPVP